MSDPTQPVRPGGPPERFADDARRYRLDSRIATGGMGEVWRATDTTLGREVAVKLLKQEYADDPAFRVRFETEARHAASLHHPGIAAVWDFGEADPGDGSGIPRPYLVMELVEGQPLSALLRPEEPMDPVVAADLMAQAADALAAAHAAGIVHRDVKPANLMVTPDRRIKITDFGIARAASGGAGVTQTGMVLGTPQYLSPEQARGTTATAASDVYALGVVAFECLAGRRPFSADTPVGTALAHLNDPVPDLPPTVPAALAGVVRRALAKRPEDRWPDAAAFAAALRDPRRAAAPPTAATQVVAPVPVAERTQVLAAPPTTTTPVAPAEPPAPARRSRAWLWALLLVVAAVAAAILITLLVVGGGTDDEPTDEPSRSERTRTRSPSEPTTSATDPATVTINAADYTGRDYREVRDSLQAQGLRVVLDEITNPGGQTFGAVDNVNPSGTLEVGSSVTVTYWGPEPTPDPPTTAPTTPTTPPTTPSSPTTPTEDASDPTSGAT